MMQKFKFYNLINAVKRRHVLLLLLAAALRFAYVFSLEDKPSFFDTVHYDSAAKSLLAGQGFGPSLHYYDNYQHYSLEPAYPLFLAGIYAVFGERYVAVRIAQLMLSLLQIYLLYRITLLLRPSAALLALGFAAIYPFFIYISGLLYSTQLFTLLLTLSIFCFLRYNGTRRLPWLITGAVALGASIVTIPVIAPAVVLIALWLFVIKGGLKKRCSRVAWLALSTALILAPWTIRNYLVFKVISPGRACLAETRAFEQIEQQLRYEDAVKQPHFDGRRFSVEISKDDHDRTLLKCYLDDVHFETLRVSQNDWAWPDTAYYGLLFYGGSELTLPPIELMGEDTAAHFPKEYLHVSELSVENNAVSLQPTTPGWKYGLVFTRPDSFNQLKMTYPNPIAPQDMQRFAFLIGLDAPSLSANGYMIWLHFWKNTDLWQIREGRPFRRIDFINLMRKEKPMTLSRLVAKEPVRFFTRHFLPELIKFWSPIITRITTSDYRPGLVQQAVSILFFTPLLIFAPIGLFVLRRTDLSSLFLLLIPIAVVAVGYSLFFVEVRYRIPIDGFLVVLASLGFYSVQGRRPERHTE